MKRLLIICLFILCMGLLLPISVNAGDIRLNINGTELTGLADPPVIIDDRVLVPVRYVFEHIGGTVNWHAGNRQVSIFYRDYVLVMTIDMLTARLDDQFIQMHTPPVILGGRTMVPLRFPAEAFGFDVYWDGDTRTAYVNSVVAEPEIEPEEDTPAHTEEEDVYEGGYTDKAEPVWDGTYESDDLPPPGAVVVVDPALLARDMTAVPITTIPAPEANIIRVLTPRETGAAAYELVASSAITGVNHFLLPDNRLVVDIENATSHISGLHFVEPALPIREVRASQFSIVPRVVRVVFELDGPTEFSISLSADRLQLTVSFTRNRITDVVARTEGASDLLTIYADILPDIRISTDEFPNFLMLLIPNASMHADAGFFNNGNFANSFTTGELADGTAFVRIALGADWPTYSLVRGTGSIMFMMHPGLTGVRYDSSNRELRIEQAFSMDINSVERVNEYLLYRYTFVLPPSADVLGRGELSVFDGFVNSVNLSRDFATGNTLLTFYTSRVLSFSIREEAGEFVIAARLPRDVYSRIVIIDPGHGGTDPGAIHHGLIEKNMVLDISRKTMELLNANPGVVAYMTRNDDSTVLNPRRAEFANGIEADLFISIHGNAALNRYAYGIETWYTIGELEIESRNRHRTNLNSRQLAQIMQRQKLALTGANDRGLRVEPNMVVLRDTTMPSVLLEVGFMSNAAEAARLGDVEYQWLLARAIYRGIAEALGIAARA